MKHFAMCIDRSRLFDALLDSVHDVVCADEGDVIDFNFGAVVVHVVVADFEQEVSSDD